MLVFIRLFLKRYILIGLKIKILFFSILISSFIFGVQEIELQKVLQYSEYMNAKQFSEAKKINFRRAELIGAFLINLNLRGADFTGAKLNFADLSNSILVGAIFRGAFVIGTCFTKADTRGADFTGAYYWVGEGFDASFN